jgi:hypothetical protein
LWWPVVRVVDTARVVRVDFVLAQDYQLLLVRITP